MRERLRHQFVGDNRDELEISCLFRGGRLVGNRPVRLWRRRRRRRRAICVAASNPSGGVPTGTSPPPPPPPPVTTSSVGDVSKATSGGLPSGLRNAAERRAFPHYIGSLKEGNLY